MLSGLTCGTLENGEFMINSVEGTIFVVKLQIYKTTLHFQNFCGQIVTEKTLR